MFFSNSRNVLCYFSRNCTCWTRIWFSHWCELEEFVILSIRIITCRTTYHSSWGWDELSRMEISRQWKLGKKRSNVELEVRTQSLLVNTMSDEIVGKIMHCDTADDIMKKVDELYGLKEDRMKKKLVETIGCNGIEVEVFVLLVWRRRCQSQIIRMYLNKKFKRVGKFINKQSR